MKQIDAIAHAARRNRTPLNVLITIRAPLDVPDAAGKREISREIGHLGEALKRRHQEHVGITVFEKSPHLHAHHLVHVRPENDDVIARRADGEVIHARPADRDAPGYITKQRRRLSPDFEAEIKRPWEKSGGAIPGNRWTATKTALALIEPKPEPVAPKVVTPPEPVVVSIRPTVDAVQLPLFEVPPQDTLSDAVLMRQFCERFGYTQERASARLGYRDRSHIANIRRGHDGMSPQRRRWLLHIMETERIAA